MTEAAAPAARRTLSDLDLLRRYEPVVRCTKGEAFLPSAVEPYFRACSLWVHHRDGLEELLVEQDRLTLETLTQPRRAEFGAVYYLKFIEPPNIAELTAWLLGAEGKQQTGGGRGFRAALGRLARVGYGSRLVDALFSLSLFLRGRVPGDTAAAAAFEGRRLREQDDR